MANQKVIMHLDMDAFFASCLQQKYPTLRNKPIVVAYADKKSIVVTSSYEARKLGVKTAMPLYLAKKVSQNQIIRVKPEYDLFSNYSEQVFTLLIQEFTPLIEIASIDECYLDVTQQWPKYGTPKKMAFAIKTSIKKQLGLTCSIGISSNKFLAKMVGKDHKPDGVGTLSPLNIRNYLWPKPVSTVYGVGIASFKKMDALGITTIKNLALADEQLLTTTFGKSGLDLKNKANGMSSDQVQVHHPDYKNISNDVTLKIAIYEEEELLEVLHSLALHVSKRAKQAKMVSRTIGLSVHYQWNHHNQEVFDKTKHHRRKNKQSQIDHYTNDAEEIYAQLSQMALETVDFKQGIYLVSVSLKDTTRVDKIPHQHQLGEESKLGFHQFLAMNQQFKRAKDLPSKEGKIKEETKFIKRKTIHYSKKTK